MLMADYLVLINSSRSLHTNSVIIFVISLYLILQMCKDSISKNLRGASKQDLKRSMHIFKNFVDGKVRRVVSMAVWHHGEPFQKWSGNCSTRSKTILRNFIKTPTATIARPSSPPRQSPSSILLVAFAVGGEAGTLFVDLVC